MNTKFLQTVAATAAKNQMSTKVLQRVQKSGATMLLAVIISISFHSFGLLLLLEFLFLFLGFVLHI